MYKTRPQRAAAGRFRTCADWTTTQRQARRAFSWPRIWLPVRPSGTGGELDSLDSRRRGDGAGRVIGPLLTSGLARIGLEAASSKVWLRARRMVRRTGGRHGFLQRPAPRTSTCSASMGAPRMTSPAAVTAVIDAATPPARPLTRANAATTPSSGSNVSDGTSSVQGGARGEHATQRADPRHDAR